MSQFMILLMICSGLLNGLLVVIVAILVHQRRYPRVDVTVTARRHGAPGGTDPDTAAS